LNIAYVEHSGVANELIDHVHSGDDVYAQVKTVSNADKALRMADEARIEFQPDKCAGGAVSEFLRIDWRAGTTGAQYLTRGCATAVHARPESRSALTLKMLIAAAQSRAAELVERGAPHKIAVELIDISTERAAQWFNTDINVAKRMRDTPAPAGGMAADDLMQDIDLMYEEVEQYKRGRYFEISKRLPGVVAYGKFMARMLKVKKDSKFIEMVAQANARLVAREPTPVREIQVVDYKQLETDRYLWKTLKGTRLAAIMSRLKGLDVATLRVAQHGVEAHAQALVAAAVNPVRWLSVVT